MKTSEDFDFDEALMRLEGRPALGNETVVSKSVF